MLKNTFIHLPGIGEKTERHLWKSGIITWTDLLNAGRGDLPRGLGLDHLKCDLELSIKSYTEGSWKYFDSRIPLNHKWRAYPDLADKALYLDIETTGFGNDITVIGIYDGVKARTYVADINLEQAVDDIERFPLVITFNGTRFDMPVIRQRFPYNMFEHIHIDLMYPLRKLGYRGGLKRIEERTGLCRSGGTAGLTGWDAVRLWREYRGGRKDSLDRLLRYNEEDIMNLKPLMERTCRESIAGMDVYPAVSPYRFGNSPGI